MSADARSWLRDGARLSLTGFGIGATLGLLWGLWTLEKA